MISDVRSDRTTTRTAKKNHSRVRPWGIAPHHALLYSMRSILHLLPFQGNLSFPPGLKSGIPRKGFRWLCLGILLWWSMGLASAEESSCEQRLVTLQEHLTDAKAVATQFYLPNMGLQAETVVTLNRKLTEALQQHAQDAATMAALQKELAMLKSPQPPAKSADEREP